MAGDNRDTAVALNPADNTWPWAITWDRHSQLTAVYSTDSENVSAPAKAKSSCAAGCHSGGVFLDSHQVSGTGEAAGHFRVTAGEWLSGRTQGGAVRGEGVVYGRHPGATGPQHRRGRARVTRGQLGPWGQTRAEQQSPAEDAFPGGVKTDEASGQGIGRDTQEVTGRTDWDQNSVGLRAKS